MGKFIEGLRPEQAETKKTIELRGGGSITVEETESGVFKIISCDITRGEDERGIGFRNWDKDVEDLDNGHSDIADCFGMSDHLQWEDVELTPDEIRAPSLDQIKKALRHIDIEAYCPDNI